jgi:hypothetical protein
VLWRIDAEPPREWSWTGFEQPRFRFDSAAGRFRTRYASPTIDGAARERYLDTGSYLPADHADHLLVRLAPRRPLRVLDLRTEANLDALGVDDRVSTSHEDRIWRLCHELADAARRWWDDLDGIVYRSRTTPSTAWNLAFFSTAAMTTRSRPLHSCGPELDRLVLRRHFTIGFGYGPGHRSGRPRSRFG